MVRVLHLLREDADFQTRRCVEHLSRELGTGFGADVRTVGRAGSLGGGVVGAGLRLRKLDQYQIVHAWGNSVLSAAAIGARAPIVHTPDVAVTERAVRWLAAAMSYRNVQVIAQTATQRRTLAGHGVPLERCHLVRPGVAFARVKRRRDPAFREALGLTDDDYVILAAGESTPQAAHADAAWAASILHVLDPRYKLLVWGRGDDVPAVKDFVRRQGIPDLLRIAEPRLGRALEFEELLPAADLVVNSSTGAVSTLPISICMAAALPIVSTVTYTASELLEDQHTALMAAKRRPRVLAQRILQLKEDGNLQWRLADMARTEAYEYFSLTRFLEQHRTVYRQIAAGDRVEVAEPAPGAGLRFHGRG